MTYHRLCMIDHQFVPHGILKAVPTAPEAPDRLSHHRVGAGEPLLLVHATWRAWLPVLPILAERHDVVAVDLPGFGGSPPLEPGVTPTVGMLADAVEDALEVLGLETVRVAGNSLGGLVALELSRRGRATGAVAIAPFGLGTDREDRRTQRRLRLVRALAPAVRPIVGPVARTAPGRAVLGGAGFQLARPWRHERAEMIAAVDDYWLAPGFEPTIAWALGHHARGLDEIGCPVTIAWGTWDLLLPFRQAARFASAIPDAQVRSLPRLGHVPMSDDPKQVADVILDGTQRSSSRRSAPGAVR